ncbi:hypothetical protein PENTCL1PPCAC_16405, partial [Pristionchus entomophagus]
MKCKEIADLPPEILTLIVSNLSLNDMLNLRVVSPWLNEFMMPVIKPDTCALTFLDLKKLKNHLAIIAEMTDRATALHFIDMLAISSSSTKARTKEKMKQIQMTIPIDRISHVDFSFFKSARIAHFRVAKILPFTLTVAHLKLLRQLLLGCTIDQISLFFDAATIVQIFEIPSLLIAVNAKHAEFIVQNMDQRDLLEYFRTHEFLARLEATDVKELSIGLTTLSILGPVPGGPIESETDFEFIKQVINCGITKITMDLEGCERDGFERFRLLPFIRDLAVSSRHVE